MSEAPLYGGGVYQGLRGASVRQARPEHDLLKQPFRSRAKWEQLKSSKGLIPESQGLDCLMCAMFAQQREGYFTEMCSGSEAGSYLRLIDLCITQE